MATIIRNIARNYSLKLFASFLVTTILCLSGTISSIGAQLDKRDCIQVNNDTTKIVCVCDELFCDKLSFDWPNLPGQASLVESSQSGDRFKVSSLNAKVSPLESADDEAFNSTRRLAATIKVKLNDKFQTILGWGGAFTDAATINIKALSPVVGEELLQSYFGPLGLQYNFGRVPIAGSDFSPRAYSYDDNDDEESASPDYNLTNWSLAKEDLKYKIPVLLRANEIVKSTQQGASGLKLFGSPWSPPKWMKTNNDFKRGFLIDDDRIYKSYANYLVKFFEAYKAAGLNFWGATVQNEPISANSPDYYFNSLQMGSEQAAKFISKYLGPALHAKGYTRDNFKLMVGDDNLGFINTQVPPIMQDPEVRKYVAGLAFHWYRSGTEAPYDMLTQVVDSIGDQIEFVLMTEACTGFRVDEKHVDLGSWQRGEAYAADIIEDLRRQAGGWIDWNLALDMGGGPNWAANWVDSPILVDTDRNKFYKQPMYYALAHFSRFFKPGSVHSGLELEVGDAAATRRQLDGLMFVAAHVTESNHVVVNVLNKSNQAKQFSMLVDGKEHRLDSIQVQPKSISTIVMKM